MANATSKPSASGDSRHTAHTKCCRSRSASKTDALPTAFINFDQLPDSANVRLPTVAALFCCSGATVWRWVKTKKIPEPRKVSEGVTVWNVGELRAILPAVRGENK